MSRQKFHSKRRKPGVSQVMPSFDKKIRQSDKNQFMPHLRQGHQRNKLLLQFFSNPLGSFSTPINRWWIAGILTVSLVGAFLGSFFLPGNLFGLGGMRLGILVSFLLGTLAKAIVSDIKAAYSLRRSLLFWSVAFFSGAIGGAILGFFFLPNVVLVISRILFGACVGSIGVILPILLIRVFIADPLGFFMNSLPAIIDGFIRKFIASGCCLNIIIVLLLSFIAIGNLIVR